MQKKSIKNIHLYAINNKFNRNIFEINDTDLAIFSIPNNQSIFKYFYTINSNESDNTFIFNSSIINDEIANFIDNFSNIINIWIMVDSDMAKYNARAKYIASSPIPEYKYKILPENIVNKDLYKDIQSLPKQNQILYFMDNDTEARLDKIKKYLYPNSKLPIKLFDSDKFSHPQNLGYLTEEARKNILLESKYYMHHSSKYFLTESLICECIPINIDSEEALEDQLKENKTSKLESVVYYSDFIKEICDDQ